MTGLPLTLSGQAEQGREPGSLERGRRVPRAAWKSETGRPKTKSLRGYQWFGKEKNGQVATGLPVVGPGRKKRPSRSGATSGIYEKNKVRKAQPGSNGHTRWAEGVLAPTRPPPLTLLGQAQQGRDPGGTQTSTATRLFGIDAPASPQPSGAGSAGQRPWRNTDFHSKEAFGVDSPASPRPSGAGSAGQTPWRCPAPKKNDKVLTRGKLNGCPWTVSGEADTLEGRGLEKTTKCCRGDQRDPRKQSVKSAAWVGRPPPLWRRLARLPSPVWGRLSRADTLEERGLEKTTKCCRGDQRDLRKQSVKSAAWLRRPAPLGRGRFCVDSLASPAFPRPCGEG
ncbi:hypothetical protein ROHU_037141 [Labeo rohita]|uniref:Uncharacterized protein n=1 Tax=Labeo rohita TaxID=84645 RepID=A0A498M5E8_LABRO|nr:hypothetical protein ROHU_037141 [Labeo rohita]